MFVVLDSHQGLLPFESVYSVPPTLCKYNIKSLDYHIITPRKSWHFITLV